MKKKADELAKAIKINSRPVPDSVLNSVASPDANLFEYFNVTVYRTGNANKGKPARLDLDSWPIYAEAYDCETNYIYVCILPHIFVFPPLLTHEYSILDGDNIIY